MKKYDLHVLSPPGTSLKKAQASRGLGVEFAPVSIDGDKFSPATVNESLSRALLVPMTALTLRRPLGFLGRQTLRGVRGLSKEVRLELDARCGPLPAPGNLVGRFNSGTTLLHDFLDNSV